MAEITIDELAQETAKRFNFKDQPYWVSQLTKTEDIQAMALVAIAEQLQDLNWKLHLIGEQLGANMNQ